MVTPRTTTATGQTISQRTVSNTPRFPSSTITPTMIIPTPNRFLTRCLFEQTLVWVAPARGDGPFVREISR